MHSTPHVRSLIVAATLLCLGASGIASAQPRGDDRRGPDHPQERRAEPDRRDADHHQPYRRGAPSRVVVEERGAGPDHDFHRGGRLSPEYRSRQYVVDDWRGHRLSAPPRGYHWVQTGGDYVLAAIATGIIADILLNH
jgi:Ni/Co efflux regulator RcnB